MTSFPPLPPKGNEGYAHVIGDPIAHSKSPIIHRFWLDALGIEAEYTALRVPRADLDDYVARERQRAEWRGCNVTMPLKLDALLLADHATDRAAAAGAANILVPRDGKLMAGNSDVGAVMALVAPLLGKDKPEGIVVLGNGGAARAVLVALRYLQVEHVRIQARDMAAALALAVEFGLSEGPSPFNRPIDLGGLINATPLGMADHPALTLDLSAMPTGGWAMDMVTDPTETTLLIQARSEGLKTIDGIAMLVEQAAASFELFFGKPPPRDRDGALLEMLR